MPSNTLGNIVRFSTHLLKHDKEMTMQRLTILALIARDTTGKGVLVRDLVQRTGLNQSSVARNLALLGERTARGQTSPLRWVEMVPDYEDPRRVRCLLTPQGQKVIAEIEELAN